MVILRFGRDGHGQKGSSLVFVIPSSSQCNDPKFSDIQVRANSADTDQTALQGAGSSLIRVFTVCLSICIFWANNPIVLPFGLNLGLLQQSFLLS